VQDYESIVFDCLDILLNMLWWDMFVALGCAGVCAEQNPKHVGARPRGNESEVSFSRGSFGLRRMRRWWWG
jgi:hypothetical protein